MVFRYRRICCVLLFFLSVSVCAGKSVLAFDRQTASALARYIMAGVYEKQGDTDLALREYKKALKADEKNTVIRLALAAAYIKQSQIPLAIEEITRVIAFEPEAVEPHAILALLYFSQNKLLESEKEYEKALQNAAKLEPKNINILKSLGVLYLQQNNFKSAENAFKSIIGISATDYEAHFYLANSLDEQQNRLAAVKELQIVLELQPDYHRALNYLGYLYVEENKNLPEAEKLIKKALELNPENGAYIDSLGWLYFKQGKLKDAFQELKRAVVLMDDSEILNHLGEVCFKMQDFTGARENWEKSLKLDPGQDRVKQKIEQLKASTK
jgi:Tfp pilus assembly protein PilF